MRARLLYDVGKMASNLDFFFDRERTWADGFMPLPAHIAADFDMPERSLARVSGVPEIRAIIGRGPTKIKPTEHLGLMREFVHWVHHQLGIRIEGDWSAEGAAASWVALVDTIPDLLDTRAEFRFVPVRGGR